MLRNYIKRLKNTSNTSPKFYLDAEVMLRNIKLFKNTSNTSPKFYLDAEVMLKNVKNCLKIQVTLHPNFIWILKSCLKMLKTV